MLRLSLNSFREEAIALVAGLVVFAVYLPLAVWVHRDFVSAGRPEGKVVELILRFEESADGGYQAQVYGSSAYKKGILYEDLTRLEEVESASCRRTLRRGGLSRWCQEMDLIRETTAGTTISCSPEGIQNSTH